MEMALRMLGVGEGDEVITTAYTYTSTASVIDHVGAKIVLADTAPDSFSIDTKVLTALSLRNQGNNTGVYWRSYLRYERYSPYSREQEGHLLAKLSASGSFGQNCDCR